jgi:fructose-1,6-bisphosphatase/inositol monophosphatase family enzyme
VATGAFTGALFGHPSHWDTLATALIAKEAGATVTTLSGTAFVGTDLTEGIVIAHPLRYSDLLERAQDAMRYARG